MSYQYIPHGNEHRVWRWTIGASSTSPFKGGPAAAAEWPILRQASHKVATVLRIQVPLANEMEINVAAFEEGNRVTQ